MQYMNIAKPETTITHIFVSIIMGMIVMYFTVDFFSESENLNRVMDSIFCSPS